MRELVIDGQRIADDTPPYIVAEIGHNHGGSLDRAKEMVRTAKDAGASSIKVQTRHPREVYAPTDEAGGYFYVSRNKQWMDAVYGKHREKLEFTVEQHADLFDYCREVGITAFSTPFDKSSADLLHSLDVPAFKVASGDATNIPLIQYIASKGKPMIVSTGGCTFGDVNRIYEALEHHTAGFALLQCSCIYPATSDILNLNIIPKYRACFPGQVVGLSTHHPRWEPSLAAYVLGARIIEHHYTNDRSWKGTDNNFSLTPSMLRELVDACEAIRDTGGDGFKQVDPREESYATERQKSLYWARDLAEGDTIAEDDVAIMCPGGGIPPYEIGNVVGHAVDRVCLHGERITDQDIVTIQTEAEYAIS